jgi:predicted enzyme related to lactoylglutathione lyase
MFKNSRAFSSFSVDNFIRAKIFYGDMLNLDVVDVPDMQGLLQLRLPGGNVVMIYTKEDHRPANYTVLNFPVDNVEEAVEKLVRSGVRFEHYDTLDIHTDEKGVFHDQGMEIAWFMDPAGNILSVLSGKTVDQEKEEALAEAGGAGA